MIRAEPIWLHIEVVLAIHESHLRAHGGLAGLRDVGLLESALSRPRHLFTYGQADLLTLAISYAAGIVRNHPFMDGNKRTGFVAAITFLELNGRRFAGSESESALQIISLANRSVNEAEFETWLRANTKVGKKRTSKKTRRAKRSKRD